MKLFAFYIGGTHELHDVRFVIASTLEETYESLRQSWWGTPKSLHIDAWGILESIEGYNIQIRDAPAPEGNDQLFFVNLGGYTQKEFTELHKNVFVSATTPVKARAKALKMIQSWESPHKDYEYDIEEVVQVESTINSNLHIHLIPTDHFKDFHFFCKRIPIGEKK
ncbi:DUF1543 domain-containing protein [Alphaproteobacteria bacterium]|jgi:hypothetical protein|nr:DUF1543 domain-containing protein [Alphaproteobacteria bacterium]